MGEGELKKQLYLLSSPQGLHRVIDNIAYEQKLDEAKKDIEKKSYWDSWYVDDEEFRELVVPEKVWRKWFGDSS